MKTILFVLLIVLSSSQSVSTDDKCTCSTVKSKFDCVTLGCTFTPSTTTTAATCTSTPTALAVVSVYCNGIKTPATNCPLTRGCAYYDGKCQHFSGCQAFTKLTTKECQAISAFCISDGVSCIDPQPCSGYINETSCKDSLIQICVWDTTVTPQVCRNPKCSEASTTLNTNELCDKFLSGCVTTGYGCADSKSLCSEYTGECSSRIGSDGLCTIGTDDKCKTKECNTAPISYSTNDECNSYVQGCITNGAGCSTVTLPECSTYLMDSVTCLKLKGSDGNCVGTSTQVCQVRTCDNAPIEFHSTDLCNQYLLGCKYNGIKCITALQNCSAYTGTKETCTKMIGLNGPCWGDIINDPSSSCRTKLCSDAETSFNTDKLCSDFLTGCLTNGQGCTSDRKVCSTYTGTNTTCAKWIGNDGKCEGTDPAVDKPCQAKTCSNAKGDQYATNDNCKAYQNGCLSTGSGCVSTNTCLTTQFQITCQGTIDCQWQGICVQNDCSKFTSISMCTNNLANGRQCIWNGSICKSKLCTDADKTTTNTNELCEKYLTKCVYSGDGCVESTASCTVYKGDKTTCPTFIANGQKCWSTSDTKTFCSVRQCTDNTTAKTDDDCKLFLTDCVTNLNGCLSVTEPCSSYIGTVEECLKFKGESGTKKCYKEDSTQKCRDAVCTDNTSSQSNDECNTFLKGCLTNGSGCVTPTTPCSSYPGSSTDQCSKFIGNGIQCWFESGGNCVDKKCSHKSTATGQDDCNTFLNGCAYNGTGCQDKTLGCDTFTGNETQCQLFYGNSQQCTRKNNCQDSLCTEKTNANSHQDCLDYAPSCRYSGVNNSCVDSTASCSTYTTMTADLCNTTTNSNGNKCYYVSNSCQDRTCDQLASATSQADCNAHLSGCIWTGTKCASKNTCTNYSNFTQAACKLAVDTANKLCWKSTATSGSCENRSCSQLTSASATDCENHLPTCTSNGVNCVDKLAACSSYTGFTQAACRTAKLTTGVLCWMEAAGPGTCAARACSDTVTSPSVTNCNNHLNTCTYNGTQCVTKAACNTYTNLSATQCQAIQDTNDKICQKTSAVLTDPCIDRSCSDTLTTFSHTNCQNYLSTCTYDGLICRIMQATCEAYTDFTQATCKETKTTAGDLCWKQYDELGKCETRTCANAPVQSSETSCRSHLSTCTYNGSACVSAQTSCSGYLDTNYLNCQKLNAYNGDVITPCWLVSGTGPCIDKQCIHNTIATTDQECAAFLTGCITTGKGCTSNTTSCSSLSSTQDGCSALVGNFKRCKGAGDVSGICSTKYCQDNTSATTDSECESFMKGCLSRGKGCISSVEPCSAYKGTKDICETFKGAGRKCTNIASATSSTSCIERKCNDNTTATSDSECAQFQVGCITSGKGCTSTTSQCTSFYGTQSQCAVFLGNSGKQICWGTSTTTASSCAIRICTHNTTAVTDTECETFLSGCITNGKGCVSPQLCSAFFGTKSTCQTFSATDKPCKGTTSTTSSACKAALCTDAPNTYDTDDQCNKFKTGCVTNGNGCVSSIACQNYQSQKSCQANTNCAFINSCQSVALTACTNLNNASQCVSTPVKTTIGKCAWDTTANGCRNWKCTDAPISLKTHAACQLLNITCTTRGSGCIEMNQCASYTEQSICISAKSINDNTCIWENNVCRNRICTDAPKALKTDEGCTAYMNGCLTTGYGCVNPPYDCTSIMTQTRCIVDYNYNPCIWLNSTNKCINYAKCTDITKTTFEECQTYSLSCTSDGTTCIPFSLCAYYTTPESCQQGTDGLCGWMTETNKCSKFTTCDQLKSTVTPNCQIFNYNCVSDGTSCITKSKCSEYTANNSCISGGIDGMCIFEQNKCRLRQCSDATDNTTNFESCWQFQAEKKCTTNGTKCVDVTNCSTYAKTYCILGNDGECIYDDTSSLCRAKICTDFNETQSSKCLLKVGLKCVSNGTKCIDIGKCSSYTDKEACNGGGTDGICVFTASANNPLVGSCKLMTSCESANTDSIACSKAPCIFVNNQCSAQTCLSQASGTKCNAITSFDKKTIKVCVPDTNGTCIEGEATSLTSSLCFELSGRTYSWNPSKNKCEKCVKSTTNNSTNTTTDQGEDETSYGLSLISFIILLFGSLY